MDEEKRKNHFKLTKERLEMGDNMNINLNMFHYKNNYINGACLSSSSDCISNLLQQFLLHPSSSFSSSSSSGMAHSGCPTDDPRRFPPAPAPLGGGGWGLVGAHGENDTDEYDCESEEGLEALADDAPPKPAPSRSSSKRSRAAEVHNLSEKRRRSRINEKMKALQNLIPNSNKTDKASMLDEAIEYLKQLQLQVQMLSMRNGLSLHPMCLPGVLQPLQFSQTRMNLGDEGGSLSMNVSGMVPENQEASVQMVFDLSNQCNSSNPASVPSMSNIITSETSFELESIQAQLGPFQLLSSSQDFCREDIVHQQQLKTNTSEFGLAASTTVFLPFDAQESDLKESINLEASMMRRDKSNSVLLKNMDHDLIISPHLTGKQGGRSDTSE